jgi:hypothetical protein
MTLPKRFEVFLQQPLNGEHLPHSLSARTLSPRSGQFNDLVERFAAFDVTWF